MSNPNPSLDFSRFTDDPAPATADPNSLDFSRFQDDDAGEVQAPDDGIRAEIGRRFESFKKVQEADRASFYKKSGLKTGAVSGIIDMVSEATTDLAEATAHPIKSAVAILEGIGEVPGGIVKAFEGGPVGFGKTIVEGVVAPLLLYPVELMIDRDMFGEGYGNELSAEERYLKGRAAAANIFGVFTGMKAGQAIKAGFIGQEALVGTKTLKGLNKAADALDPGELASLLTKDVHPYTIKKLVDTAGKPEFLMNAKAGLADAVVGGGVVGFLEGSGYEDRLSAATTLAIVALPFGLAAEGLVPVVQHVRGKRTLMGRADRIAQTAGEITRLREINFVEGQTVGAAGFNIATLLETQSTAMTMARKAIEYEEVIMAPGKETLKYGRNMGVVPQVVDPSDALSQLARQEGPEYMSGIHKRDDGTFDVLIAPTSTMPRTIEFFERTGYAEGQQVGYNGSTDFFIESAARTGKRTQFDKVNLLPMRGGPKIEGVPVKDLSRPTSAVMHDLYVMEGRRVGVDYVIDPNSGMTSEGANNLNEVSMGAANVHDMKDITMQVAHMSGKTLTQENGSFVVYDGRPSIPGTVDGNVDLSTRQVLKPGVNHIESVDPQTGLKRGAHIYIGGGHAKVEFPYDDGTSARLIQKIGEADQVLGYTSWKEIEGPNGKVYRGTENAAILQESEFMYGSEIQKSKTREEAKLWQSRNKALRRPISDAMNEARVKDRLFSSLSNISLGAQIGLARRMNRYFPDEVINRFGYMSPDVVRRALFSGFMDHIGLIGDNMEINPAQHVTQAATMMNDPNYFRKVITKKDNIVVEAKRGQTMAHLEDQVDHAVAGVLAEGKQPQLYKTEDGVLITREQAAKLLHDQNKRGEVAVHRNPDFIHMDVSGVPFDTLVNSFLDSWAIKPEMRPAVRLLVEQEMGRELLGNTDRIPNADKRLIPQLQNEVAKIDKMLSDPAYADPNDQTTLYREEQRIRDVFQKRIELAQNPQPKALAPEELAVFNQLAKEAQLARQEAGRNLLSIAHEYQFVPEREGGVIKLRDGESNALLPVTFINEADASDWIKNTGHPKGIDLDGGGGNVVPPSAIMGGAMPPGSPSPRPYEVPYEFSPDSRVTKVMGLLDSVAPWFTPKRAFFTAIDNQFGTTFLRDVYFPLQTARMKLEAAKRPHLLKLQSVEQQLVDAKIPRERWTTISDYREAMSPQDVINELYTNRKLTDVEQKYANEFAKQKIDTVKVYAYERDYNAAKEAFDKQLKEALDSGASQDVLVNLTAKWDKTDKELVKAHMMDDAHLNAHSIFTKIRASNPAVVRLDGVTRLTRALIDQSPNKADFAAANNMTPLELKLANDLTQMYKDAGTVLGVDQSVTHYMNHYKVTGDFSPAEVKVTDAALSFEQRNSKFASDLMRSGEMSVHERDPIKAYIQYVNKGFANRLFDKAWDKALAALEKNTNAMPDGREAMAKIGGEYLYGIKGVPAAKDILMQQSMDKFLNSLDIKMKIDVRQDIINTYMAASSGALLGFRVMQGIRDFTGFSKMYYTRFGAQRYTKALELAFTRDKDGVLPLRKLAEEGTVPGLSLIDFMSDDELSNSLTGKAGNKFKELIFKSSKIGMETSGQTSAYALAHAMAYLETRNRSAEWLNKLHSGLVTKAEAYKKLSINTYDVPVIKIFDDLVKDGKFIEASEFLGQTTGGETAFIYGLANHAHGWGTNWGRIAGQYGTFALWTRNFVGRVAGRGTAGERAAGLARLAAAETATYLTGRTLGFDMRAWSIPMGMAFAGGPMHDRVQQMMALAGARGNMQQGLAVGQWKARGGIVPGLSTNIPGGMALADYYKAYTAKQNRYGWVPVIGRGMGFKIDETQRSFLDVLADEHPKLK